MRFLANPFRLMILCAMAGVLPSVATADEAAALKGIQQLGGHVLPLAGNDSRLEVSLHLARKVDDAALKLVSQLPEVVWLNLAGTAITDEGLANLSELKSLEKLHLERTSVGDAGLKHLEALQNLAYLNLYGTQVTDEGLNSLKKLKKLQRLYLWQTPVTDAGVEGLKQAVPGLQVMRAAEFVVIVPPAEDKKPEDKKPEDKKPEDKKPEDKKPEDKKPD